MITLMPFKKYGRNLEAGHWRLKSLDLHLKVEDSKCGTVIYDHPQIFSSHSYLQAYTLPLHNSAKSYYQFTKLFTSFPAPTQCW